MSTYPIVLVTDHQCYWEMYWTQNSGILLNTDGDEYAEIHEEECLSQVLSRRLCFLRLYGRKYPQPNSFHRSLISLHGLFTWRFLWSNFPKSNSQKPKTGILKKLWSSLWSRGSFNMHVSAFILQLWHRKQPVGVSQKRKRHFCAYNDCFFKIWSHFTI